ncbi:aminotransferase class V-fold PLP-dependent enzyme [Phosphitispora sp. TUW77]|uniref:aminotransferase class V-fold PLP-dependent enzyme n=1 Tax=Phosphitispora sp. TUW77 TaxID=3152361 RepID=UPI003AB807D0
MIYLDNAATTWPKPDQIIESFADCIKNAGANPGRGGHKMSLAAGRLIYKARQTVAELFNIDNPSRVVFTGSATQALNLVLKGFLKPGSHVVTSSMEHNAAARPLHFLKKYGVEVSEVQCSPMGFLDPIDVEKAIKKNTTAIVLLHASNVTGTIMPVEQLGKIAVNYGVKLILDAAQTAGLLDIDVNKLNIDALAFAGHKSLYGPQGTGGLFIREGMEFVPLLQGGTGSKSESLEQPVDLPDKFESGTPNTPGIACLAEGVRLITEKGLEQIRRHENLLLHRFLDGLKLFKEIEIYGPCDPMHQVPVVSLNIKDQDSSEIAFVLDSVFDIACRSGLHCSPQAHKTIGTLERGTVRFSFSMYNTIDDVDSTLNALDKIITEMF